MEAFMITLREGMEIALVVGLVLAYLRKTQRQALSRYVYAGLALALLASLAGAAAFQLLGIDPENELLEGILFATAAVLVASLALWMQRVSHGLGRVVAARIEGLEERPGRQGLGLLGFTFLLVLREGVEMVLFLAVLSLTAGDGLLQLLGGLAGIGLAALFGFLLVKGTMRINLQRFFAATSVVLALLVARLLAGSVHEFTEVGLLPTPPIVMTVVGFVVKDTTSTVLLILLILLPVVAMLPDGRRVAEPAPGDESGPARRLRLAAAQRVRRWQLAATSLTLAVGMSLGWTSYSTVLAAYRPEPMEAPIVGGHVHVDATNFEEGRLHKVVYHGTHAHVRFLIVKVNGQDVAVAMDACAICPPVGYRQEGDQLICENCNAPINLETVGMAGGCNPLPLSSELEAGTLKVPVDELDANQARFQA